MAGIRIAFFADTTAAIRGVSNLDEALDDTASALDDVSRESQATSRTTGQAFDRMAGDADSATTQMERSFRDVIRATRDAGDEVGDSMRQGYRDAERAARSFEDTADDATDEAADATGEFKDEARSNFSEVASSFSGDMTSAADLVQGTLGGLAGSLAGPAGLAAGALAIIGGTMLSSITTNAEKSKQVVSDMYDDFLESGADFLSKDYIADQLAKIYQGAEDAAIKVSALRDLAKSADIPEPLLARALVGDKAAREEVSNQIASKRLAINEALDDATARGENMAPVYAPVIQALQDVEDQLEGVAGNADEAQRNAQAAADAIRGIDASSAARSAQEAQAQFDGLGRKISDIPKEVTVKARVQVDDQAWRDWLLTQRRAGNQVPVRGVPQPV